MDVEVDTKLLELDQRKTIIVLRQSLRLVHRHHSRFLCIVHLEGKLDLFHHFQSQEAILPVQCALFLVFLKSTFGPLGLKEMGPKNVHMRCVQINDMGRKSEAKVPKFGALSNFNISS